MTLECTITVSTITVSITVTQPRKSNKLSPTKMATKFDYMEVFDMDKFMDDADATAGGYASDKTLMKATNGQGSKLSLYYINMIGLLNTIGDGGSLMYVKEDLEGDISGFMPWLKPSMVMSSKQVTDLVEPATNAMKNGAGKWIPSNWEEVLEKILDAYAEAAGIKLAELRAAAKAKAARSVKGSDARSVASGMSSMSALRARIAGMRVEVPQEATQEAHVTGRSARSFVPMEND